MCIIACVFCSWLQAARLWDLLQSGGSGHQFFRPHLQRKGRRSSKAGGGTDIIHCMHNCPFPNDALVYYISLKITQSDVFFCRNAQREPTMGNLRWGICSLYPCRGSSSITYCFRFGNTWVVFNQTWARIYILFTFFAASDILSIVL